VTFIEYKKYDYRGTKIEKNQEQEFISEEQLKNVQCERCLTACIAT